MSRFSAHSLGRTHMPLEQDSLTACGIPWRLWPATALKQSRQPHIMLETTRLGDKGGEWLDVGFGHLKIYKPSEKYGRKTCKSFVIRLLPFHHTTQSLTVNRTGLTNCNQTLAQHCGARRGWCMHAMLLITCLRFQLLLTTHSQTTPSAP